MGDSAAGISPASQRNHNPGPAVVGGGGRDQRRGSVSSRTSSRASSHASSSRRRSRRLFSEADVEACMYDLTTRVFDMAHGPQGYHAGG